MEPTSSPEPPEASVDVPRESARTILFQFVVFPLGVVLVGVVIFVLFGMITGEDHSIRESLNEIRSGSSHRRWQAAYQLSKSIKRGEAKNDPGLVREVESAYVDAKGDDPKVRRYLSIVLGTLGDRSATPTLIRGLSDREPENRIYAVLALAELGDPRAVAPIAALAGDEDADVRKTAVYALGALGRPEGVEPIANALRDPVPDVRWNAALALARFHDDRAIPILREMLDRSRLGDAKGIREDQLEGAMIEAVRAYASVAGPKAVPELEAIAGNDPSLAVRSAAKEALSTLSR